ncbi:MAG: tetratricopeptide repeat protein [Exilibacterium sp.]
MEKARASAEQNFGEAHPTTAVGYSNLAVVLKALGDYDGALVFVSKALGNFKKSLPSGHPNIRIAENIYQSINDQRQSS